MFTHCNMSVLGNSEAGDGSREALWRTGTRGSFFFFLADAFWKVLCDWPFDKTVSFKQHVGTHRGTAVYVCDCTCATVTYRACSAAKVVHGNRKHISQVEREPRCDEQTALRTQTEACMHTQIQKLINVFKREECPRILILYLTPRHT